MYLVTSLHSWQVKFFLNASIFESSLTIVIGTDMNNKYPLNEWLNEELNFVPEESRLEMAFGKATISTTEKVNDFSNNVKLFFSWFNLPSSFYKYWDKKKGGTVPYLSSPWLISVNDQTSVWWAWYRWNWGLQFIFWKVVIYTAHLSMFFLKHMCF